MADDILRGAIAGALVFAGLIAVGSWAVTARRVQPFGWIARLIRRVGDPFLVPIERMILRRGGNPQHAPWWFLGGVIIGGILLLSVLQVLLGMLWGLDQAVRQGPRGIVRYTVVVVGNILMVALVVRVVGSWLGAGRYNRWTRWSWPLTDWLVVPIQRMLPAFGMLDFSPLVAWLAIWLGMTLLLGFL